MKARHASSVCDVSAMPRGGPQAGWLDRRMDPHTLEWIDDPAVPVDVRRRTMAGLDRFNHLAGGYWIFAHTALRFLPATAVDPRVLELGAGSGELSARIAERLAREGRVARIVASDISEDYVASMRANPWLKKLGIEIARVDATESGYPDNSFDLAVFTQALHHLDPPQVIRLLSEGTRIASRLLIIDAWRSPLVFAFSPAFWLLGNYGTFRDGIVSLRRMYSKRALLHLGGLCPQRVRLDISFLPPGYMRCLASRVD